MSVKQLALLSYYLHLKHVSETAGLIELLLTVHLKHVSETAGLTELLLTVHLKHVSETALLSTTYTWNMSVKQLALLSYYLHLKHVSETAGLIELLLTPPTCQWNSQPF